MLDKITILLIGIAGLGLVHTAFLQDGRGGLSGLPQYFCDLFLKLLVSPDFPLFIAVLSVFFIVLLVLRK